MDKLKPNKIVKISLEKLDIYQFMRVLSTANLLIEE